ncbi:MAG: selenocysteine-specific translation elongation factor [Anaerolineaceae bacterium]
MKYVIATAGHVDHGKSSLVKALTGINPDRLKEEQQRQMTIDLGFAWFTLPSGDEVGIVDVPGHRDFISNMLAGIGSIDAVLLVVAADEGVMPQTLEHIMILDLLEINKGLIAITKTDLIQDQDWLRLVEKDIRDAIRDTNLQDFPFVPVSIVNGSGISELVQILQNILSTVEHQELNEEPHLAVDRVFSIKGFGTVVTGTLRGGELKVGEEVEILPTKKVGRIRSIETHKQKLEKAATGSRVALNITGVDVNEIYRGNVIVRPGSVRSTLRLDAQIRIISSASGALKHNDQVKLYHGTSEMLARVRTLGKDAIQPGDSGLVQLELSTPLVGWKGDRFVIRRPSPQETIGGGQIINPVSSKRYKRYSEKTMLSLDAQRAGSVWDVFSLLIEEKILISKADLEQSFLNEGFTFSDEQDELRTHAEFMEFSTICSQKDLVQFFTTKEELIDLSEKINSDLSQIYQSSSSAPGILLTLMSKKIGVEDCVLHTLLDQGLLDANLGLKKGYLFHKDRQIQFSEKDLHKIERLDNCMEKEPFTPPSLEAIQEITGNDLLQTLLFMEKLIQVDDSIIFRDIEFNQIKDQLIQFLEKHDEITLAQFRDLLNTSRKYALAFLDSMDKMGVTERVGEIRKLKTSG